MTTRTVTGSLTKLDGTAWASADVIFELLTSFETSTEVVPRHSLVETTDASGDFSITLQVPDSGTAHYLVRLPDSQSYEFYLAAGAATDLQTIITIAGTAVAQDDLQTLIDTHNATRHPSQYVVQAFNDVAIQAQIDAAYAAGGGDVFLPAGTYTLSDSLVLKNGVTIRGVFPSASAESPLSWDIDFTVDSGTIITYPGGTVFTQPDTAGVGTLSALTGVTIENLGFDNVGSVLTIGRANESGLCESVIRNIVASNVTGVAFDLVNPLHVRMDYIKASCVQFVRITSNYDAAVLDNQPGNCYFSDLYAYITADGHALPSVHLRALDTNSAGRYLNYLHFVRLQVNRFTSAAKEGNHIRVEGEGNAALVNNCTLDGVDLEGAAAQRIYINQVHGLRINFCGNAANGADVEADIYARNCIGTYMVNTDQGLTLDMDATAQPFYWHGVMYGVVGAGYFPIGIWHDATLYQTRLSLNYYGALGTVIGDISNEWTMPIANFLNFENGGDVRQRVIALDDDLDMSDLIVYLGVTLLRKADNQAITLPDATTCGGQRATFKKTVSGGTATLTAKSGQYIDGSASNAWMDAQYKFITIQSDGANWLIVAQG